jgi:ribosomal protein S18 acetylase RimI-like enzyme
MVIRAPARAIAPNRSLTVASRRSAARSAAASLHRARHRRAMVYDRAMDTIRALAPSDAALWLTLRLRALREHPTAFLASEEEDTRLGVAGVAERLASPHDRAVTIGAFDGDALVGSVGIARASMMKMAHRATLWGMYVAPEHRRAALGRRLVHAAIEAARAMPGVECVALSVDEQNLGAQALYRSAGFEAWGTERDMFRAGGRSVDELHMVLRL